MSQDFAPLSRMRVRNDSVDSSMATYIAKQMGQNGADIPADPTDDPLFARFVNNEITYEEYMKKTGGTTYEDELQMINQNDQEAMPPPKSVLSPRKKKTRSNKNLPKAESLFSNVDLPPELKSRFLIDSESGEFVASQGPSVVAELAASLDSDMPGPSKGGRVRKANKAIDGLMGQANVAFANQRYEEAIQYLKEAIRQEPRIHDPYQQMADIYLDLNNEVLSFEFKLLACHLNAKTTAGDWANVGETAVKLDRIELAVACYGNAIRCQPNHWFYYEKRIELLEALGLARNAMRVRLQAAQAVDCRSSNVDFEWMHNLIKTAAEYYIDCLDEDKAMEALKIFLLRCHEFGRMADVQHLALLGMWIGKDRFDECVKSILALCQDIKALDEEGNPVATITVNNLGYTFRPENFIKIIDRFDVPSSFNTLILAKLVICLQRLGCLQPINSLIDTLLNRAIYDENEANAFIDIGRAFYELEYLNNGVIYLNKLIKLDRFADHPEVLHLFGLIEQQRNNNEVALGYYRQVLEIQPGFVNARINLSTILQKLGRTEEALQTLMDYDLDLCTQLPDERLLRKQADVLKEQKHVDQYIRCLRMLLIPHFFPIYKFQNYMKRSRSRGKVTVDQGGQCAVLHKAMMETLRGSVIERQIKRLGAAAYNEGRSLDDLTKNELHDYCMKLLEALHDNGRFTEMAEIVYLSTLQPVLQNANINTFMKLVLYASIKAKHHQVTFEYLRYLYSNMNNRVAYLDPDDSRNYTDRIYNAMNYVFSRYQNVACHRFIMRAEVKTPIVHLQVIAGNNSLVTGSYRHALSEYLGVWVNRQDCPLINFLVGLTFIHMACKKDISSRHMLAIRGAAFVQRYQKLRGGQTQETMYNMARMLHQLGIMSGAIYFYEKVLNETEPPLVINEDGAAEPCEKYDLRPMAAHNLALIYQLSGNKLMARKILLTYSVI